MPSEKPWTSSSVLPRNWILTKIMPPDCLAWQPGGVFVCGGFDGYGMTRRNVVYLPIYSRFQSTCHIRGMTCSRPKLSSAFGFQSTCHIRGMTVSCHLHPPRNHFNPHATYVAWHQPLSRKHRLANFNPHATYVAWPLNKQQEVSMNWFQSTCHIRGMTRIRRRPLVPLGYFNPHATYVAWLRAYNAEQRHRNFNPHATYVAWRPSFPRVGAVSFDFNPHATYVAWR